VSSVLSCTFVEKTDHPELHKHMFRHVSGAFVKYCVKRRCTHKDLIENR